MISRWTIQRSDGGKWVFNPDNSHRVRSGTALIVMATPEGRKAIESILGWV